MADEEGLNKVHKKIYKNPEKSPCYFSGPFLAYLEQGSLHV
jgi:hypothetical protein